MSHRGTSSWRSTVGAWVSRAAGLGALVCSTPALAMDKCPEGTGSSPWLPLVFWGSLALSLVLIIIRATVLRTVPEQPRPHGQAMVIFFAILSPLVGMGLVVYGILFCAPLTQAPEIVCEHLAEEASRSQEPVGFDTEACLEAWRAEENQLSWGDYRELSSCAMRIRLGYTQNTVCEPKGFDLARHAPGTWPADDDVKRD